MTNRSDVYVVDTHALIWWALDDSKLSNRANGVFASAEKDEARLLVPTVVLAEMLHLSEGRIPEIPTQEVLDTLASMDSVTITPFDFATFRHVLDLPHELQIHDRIIAATGRVFDAPIRTMDTKIAAAVSTVWN